MSKVDYEKLAKDIPAEWYDKEELQKLVRSVFTKLVDGIAERMNKKIESQEDLDDLYKAISSKNGEPVEKIEESFVSDSSVFGRLEMFEDKYPEIFNKLPRNEKGNPIYPTPILAKILNVDDNLAEEMAKYYFGQDPFAGEDESEIVH